MLVVTIRCALLKLWSISADCQRGLVAVAVGIKVARTLKSKSNRLLKLLKLFGKREIPWCDRTGARHREQSFVYGFVNSLQDGVGGGCSA